MLVGFQDDPAFRWSSDRTAALDRARQGNATLIRTFVEWSKVAETRPANPADPADPAYKWGDLDELVVNAQARGIQVLMTIWGTPAWANAGKGPMYLPRRLGDLTDFSRALATRYSGRYAGVPGVRMFTVWNEPNLGQFLSPQFVGERRSVAPLLYANLYRAAYKGLKQGNPRALIGIGETSPRGKDKRGRNVQDSHSPGRFAELVAKACRGCKFDAYAHHPYPTEIPARPMQRVSWPNVTLSMMPRFEKSLAQWFGRKKIRIWITEYGHQTSPALPAGIPTETQAKYLAQALRAARQDGRVDAFVWFIFRDNPVAGGWQSGLFNQDWTTKPAYDDFTSLAGRMSPPPRLALAAQP